MTEQPPPGDPRAPGEPSADAAGPPLASAGRAGAVRTGAGPSAAGPPVLRGRPAGSGALRRPAGQPRRPRRGRRRVGPVAADRAARLQRRGRHGRGDLAGRHALLPGADRRGARPGGAVPRPDDAAVRDRGAADRPVPRPVQPRPPVGDRRDDVDPRLPLLGARHRRDHRLAAGCSRPRSASSSPPRRTPSRGRPPSPGSPPRDLPLVKANARTGLAGVVGAALSAPIAGGLSLLRAGVVAALRLRGVRGGHGAGDPAAGAGRLQPRRGHDGAAAELLGPGPPRPPAPAAHPDPRGGGAARCAPTAAHAGCRASSRCSWRSCCARTRSSGWRPEVLLGPRHRRRRRRQHPRHRRRLGAAPPQPRRHRRARAARRRGDGAGGGAVLRAGAAGAARPHRRASPSRWPSCRWTRRSSATSASGCSRAPSPAATPPSSWRG